MRPEKALLFLTRNIFVKSYFCLEINRGCLRASTMVLLHKSWFSKRRSRNLKPRMSSSGSRIRTLLRGGGRFVVKSTGHLRFLSSEFLFYSLKHTLFLISLSLLSLSTTLRSITIYLSLTLSLPVCISLSLSFSFSLFSPLFSPSLGSHPPFTDVPHGCSSEARERDQW